MQSEDKLDGPAVDRWCVPGQTIETEEHGDAVGFDIFSLSAGVMTSQTRTSNRIDGLLSHMLENPTSRYIGNVDKNLDYLFTHLQLDMLERIGKDVSNRNATARPKRIQLPVLTD